jgi:hypothetical protein
LGGNFFSVEALGLQPEDLFETGARYGGRWFRFRAWGEARELIEAFPPAVGVEEIGFVKQGAWIIFWALRLAADFGDFVIELDVGELLQMVTIIEGWSLPGG